MICSYLVHGGLVFTALTQMYLSHQWGRDWEEKAPIWLCVYVTHGFIEKPGQQIVILSQVKCVGNLVVETGGCYIVVNSRYCLMNSLLVMRVLLFFLFCNLMGR